MTEIYLYVALSFPLHTCNGQTLEWLPYSLPPTVRPCIIPSLDGRQDLWLASNPQNITGDGQFGLCIICIMYYIWIMYYMNIIICISILQKAVVLVLLQSLSCGQKEAKNQVVGPHTAGDCTWPPGAGSVRIAIKEAPTWKK